MERISGAGVWCVYFISLLLVGMGCTATPYQRADRRALSQSRQVVSQNGDKKKSKRKRGPTLKSLALYLTKGLSTEREKARAIYRWITANISYDARGYLTGRYGDLSAKGVLRRRKAVCEGYARLFLRLAQAAGLKAVKIHGLAKGRSYSQRKKGINHAWNAVKFEGKWHLVDSTWGAGHTKGTRFIRRFRAFYFTPPPAQMAYTHLPKEPRWQLVPKPLSRKAFLAQMRINPIFFRYRMRLISPQKALVRVANRATFQLKVPPKYNLILGLRWFHRRLRTHSHIRMQRDGEHVKIDVQFPYPGSYKLQIFASAKRNSSHPMVLAYQIQADNKRAMPRIKPQYMRHCYAKTPEGQRYNKCLLAAPRRGHLRRNQMTLFKVRIPGAKRAFLKLAGKRYHLRRIARGVFEAHLSLPDPGRAIIFAQFGRSTISWGTIGFIIF